jgi:DNA-binding SARP family transcriptional activator
MNAHVVINLFGTPQVFVNKKLFLPTPTHKGILLLATLILNCNQSISRNTLAFRLWPDVSESRAKRNLNTEIWRLRQVLGDMLLSNAKSVCFSPTPACVVDIFVFDEAAHSSDFQKLEDRLAVYKGEFLSGFYEDWVILKREYYQDKYIDCLDESARYYQSVSLPRKAAEFVKKILALNPVHEESHQRLMRLYAQIGDYASAIRQYQACASILTSEMGLQPLAETQALYERILKQSKEFVTDAPLLLHAGKVFIGREEYLKMFRAKWNQVHSGGVETLVVTGEAGVGKTKLVEHWLDEIAETGIVLQGHCYEANKQSAFSPIIEMIKYAAAVYGKDSLLRLPAITKNVIKTLVPDLQIGSDADKTNQHKTSAYARELTFYSLIAGLKAWATTDKPLTIFLDDAHWADDETLEFLYLLKHQNDGSLLLLFTYRPNSLELADFSRIDIRIKKLNAQTILLNPLSRHETIELIRKMGKMIDTPQEFAGKLFSETEGNPLFLIESLKALFEKGYLSTNADGAWLSSIEKQLNQLSPWPLSATLHQLIQKRTERLSATQKNVLAIASVIGREFNRETLLSLSGMQALELNEVINSLLQSGLIKYVSPPNVFYFHHVKIQESILASLTDKEQISLHAKIAKYFESLPERVALVETLAHHYMRAKNIPLALKYLEQAGDKAIRFHAYQVASVHIESALTLCQTAQTCQRAFELLMKLYFCQWAMESDHDKLQTILDKAKEFANQKSDFAKIHFFSGTNLISRGLWKEALDELQNSLHHSTQSHLPEFEMKTHLELANVYGHNLEYEDALTHAKQGLRIAKRIKNFHAISRARWEISEFTASLKEQAEVGIQIAHEAMQRDAIDVLIELGSSCVGGPLLLGNFGEAMSLGESIMEYGKQFGLVSVLGRSVQRVLARVYFEIGEYEHAMQLIKDSLRLTRLSSYRYGEMRCLANLGSIMAGMSKLDEALAELNRASQICKSIGSRGDDLNIKTEIAFVLMQYHDEKYFVSAESLLSEIVSDAHASHAVEAEAIALSHLSRLYLLMNQPNQALIQSKAAIQILENHVNRIILPTPFIRFQYACALRAVGDENYKQVLFLARQAVYCRIKTLPKERRRSYLHRVALNHEILSTH